MDSQLPEKLLIRLFRWKAPVCEQQGLLCFTSTPLCGSSLPTLGGQGDKGTYVAAMKNKAEGVAESKRSMGTLGLSSLPPPHLRC